VREGSARGDQPQGDDGAAEGDAMKLSPAQTAMLRLLIGHNSVRVPYRRGAINTAESLRVRGLIVMWTKNHGHLMALTDAGRTELAAMDQAVG
jgi:hypothetical protein